MAENKLVSVDFEIFGNVQGVCFRMYTEDHGRSLGLSGWVKNTRQGTVIGQVQGPWDKVNDMVRAPRRSKMHQEARRVRRLQEELGWRMLRKHWLKSVGSPSSRIDRAVFSNERDISKLEIHGFITRY